MTCTCSHCQKQIYPYTHLEEWRKASCFNDPWGFWQWDHDKLRTKGKGACSSIVRQSNNHHGCPADTLGRDNIALAILEAEQMYRDNLGYPVVPEWHQKEVASFAWGCGQSWRNGDRLVLPYGHIQHVGAEVCETIGEVVKGDQSLRVKGRENEYMRPTAALGDSNRVRNAGQWHPDYYRKSVFVGKT